MRHRSGQSAQISDGAATSKGRYNVVFQDCTFTGNASGFGSATHNSVCLRCRFHDNSSMPGAKNNVINLVAYGIAASCVFEDNPGDSRLASPGVYSDAYNCTIYVPNGSSSSYAYTTSLAMYNSIVWSPAYFPNPNPGNGRRRLLRQPDSLH